MSSFVERSQALHDHFAQFRRTDFRIAAGIQFLFDIIDRAIGLRER